MDTYLLHNLFTPLLLSPTACTLTRYYLIPVVVVVESIRRNRKEGNMHIHPSKLTIPSQQWGKCSAAAWLICTCYSRLIAFSNNTLRLRPSQFTSQIYITRTSPNYDINRHYSSSKGKSSSPPQDFGNASIRNLEDATNVTRPGSGMGELDDFLSGRIRQWPPVYVHTTQLIYTTMPCVKFLH